MESHIEKAAKLLNKASNVLLSANRTEPISLQQSATPARRNLQLLTDSVNRTRQMLQQSSSAGLFQLMNNAEKLRSTSSTKAKKRKPSCNEKAFDFPLLNPFDELDEDSERQDKLKWDSEIADGIVLISEDSSEKETRGKIRDALIKKFSLISANDFIFAKVCQKKISIPEISEGTEFGFPVIKKLAGQGTLYIRIKSHCTFVLHNDDNSNQDNNESTMVKSLDPTASNIHSVCFSTESASLCSEHEASLEVNDIPSLTLVVSGNDTAAINETLTEVSGYKLQYQKSV